MRKSREEAHRTRALAVQAASRIVRAKGVAGVSVAEVMGALGMTVGGFYKHFGAKEDLIAEAIESASTETAERLARASAVASGRSEQLARLVDAYLSPEHRAAPEDGCPVAALASEIAHEGGAAKQAFSSALQRLIQTVAEASPSREPDDVLHTVAALVGAVALSRACVDPALSEAIVRSVRAASMGPRGACPPEAFAGARRTRYSRGVTSRAQGTFDITATRHPPYDTGPSVTLARTTFSKEFRGDLEGTSAVEMLSAVTEVKGSAGYVALERVRGTLHGKRGTFVLQHSGTMNRGVASLDLRVVPDSGTDELTGLAGSMSIEIVEGKHYYVFEYTLGVA